MIVGIGVDLVSVSDFREQFYAGSTFAGAFSGPELREARLRAEVSGDLAQHLAGRWAAKEAFVKAWFAADGQVMAPEELRWDSLQVLGAPPRLHVPVDYRSHVSISHDGGFATAMVVLEQ